MVPPSPLLVDGDHVLRDVENPFPQGPRRKNADLVAVSEDPPAYLAEPIDAELDDGRAVAVMSDLLGAVHNRADFYLTGRLWRNTIVS